MRPHLKLTKKVIDKLKHPKELTAAVRDPSPQPCSHVSEVTLHPAQCTHQFVFNLKYSHLREGVKVEYAS